MFGLLNLDDEQKAAMLRAAGMMMQSRGNFGQAAGAGLLGYADGKQQYRAQKDQRAEAEQQRELRQMQMAQMKQAQENLAGMRQAFQGAYSNPNLVRGDDEGSPMPQAPTQFDPEAFKRNAAPFMDPMQALQMMQPEKPDYMPVAPGASVFDKRSGKEVFRAPDKPDGPKLGQTREIKSGGNVITYEWDGKQWAKIAAAPQFKPDGPEKPEKPPQGYRDAGGGNLVFIPGGPADPNRPGAKTPEHPTEDERRSAGLTVRMESALKTIKGNDGASKPELLPSAIRAATGNRLEALPNTLTSGPRQQVESAQLDALDAALTLATGAAYTKEQLQNLRKSYFPQLGDQPATVKEKERRFAEVIETARIRAGRAAKTIDPVLNGQRGGGGWSIRAIP